MIHGATLAEGYIARANRITDPVIKEAFCYLLGVLATQEAFTLRPEGRPATKPLLLQVEDETHLEVSVSAKELSCVLTRAAAESGRYDIEAIADTFDAKADKKSGTQTLLLADMNDVKTFLFMLDIEL